LFATDGRIEVPVEVFQRLERPEVGGFGAASQHPLVTHVQLILQDEFEELAVAETTGGGFLQTHVESLQETGETELAEGALELDHEVCEGSMVCAGSMR
jgi:hypothetical protein